MSKILVICFSSINNVAMAIPVIHSLATQYAQHQIMVLSIDTFSPLFENVPDNVIFRGADFRGEHAGLMGLGWLYNDLKEEKFDAVAAFQPTFRSRFLCWRFRLAGIKAAHIKQNRRELQKLIRRKHKIYTEQDSFFQRCAHTLSQIGYPIRLSFLSLFGKNKGNISSLSPLTGEAKSIRCQSKSRSSNIYLHATIQKSSYSEAEKKKSKYWKNGPNISPMSSQQPAN